MVDLGSQFRQHSAAEVEEMSPEQAMQVREAGASYQRGRPEQAMNDYQRFHSGVKGSAVEHVGDLTHRMNESRMTNDIVQDTTVPKIKSQLGNLGHPYGFDREHGEQIASNARYHGRDRAEHAATEQQLSQAYADEHKRVPVYNYPSEVARDAAVSLGEGRHDEARGHLEHLHNMQFGGHAPPEPGSHSRSGMRYDEGDMMALLDKPRMSDEAGLRAHQRSMVDYLRGRESETPAITDAATVLLGGRLQRD